MIEYQVISAQGVEHTCYSKAEVDNHIRMGGWTLKPAVVEPVRVVVSNVAVEVVKRKPGRPRAAK